MTGSEIRKKHLIQFQELTPAERLNWALTAGLKAFNMLPEKQKKSYLSFRNGGKKLRDRMLAGCTEGTK